MLAVLVPLATGFVIVDEEQDATRAIIPSVARCLNPLTIRDTVPGCGCSSIGLAHEEAANTTEHEPGEGFVARAAYHRCRACVSAYALLYWHGAVQGVSDTTGERS